MYKTLGELNLKEGDEVTNKDIFGKIYKVRLEGDELVARIGSSWQDVSNSKYPSWAVHRRASSTVKPKQVRPVDFITEVDALAKKHNLTITGVYLDEGVYNFTVVGE